MSERNSEYGITIKNALLREIRNKSDRTIFLGTIFKVETIVGGQNLCVKFLKDGETWESNVFICPRDHVTFITENLWPYLAAVTSPKERVKLALNPKKCKKIMDVVENTTVSFIDDDKGYIGIVKHKGNVKGMGKCFGIHLHEKKIGNRCDGSCAGIQYFHCLPGYGIFTTIEKIIPQDTISDTTDNNISSSVAITDLDVQLQKNVISFEGYKQNVENKFEKTENKTVFKPSTSLQNIPDSYSINTTNDFDQNTILQPDSTYLLNKQFKGGIEKKSNNKNEIDLIDAIGGSWSGTTEQDKLPSYSNLKKTFNNDKIHSNNTTTEKEKNSIFRTSLTKNLTNHNSSKTLPKKTKLNSKEGTSPTPKSNFYIEINERGEDVIPQDQLGQKSIFFDPEPGTTNDLTKGSLVEVMNDVSDEPLYGVIRWMGVESGTSLVIAGVELEDDQIHLPLTLTDGVYKGCKFFDCATNKALFVPLSHCHKDSRFQDGTPTPVHNVTEKMFGKDCPVIKGHIAPLCLPTEEDVFAVCGQFRGIQGHHNSCYLDATLFAMFTYTTVFDSLLYRPKNSFDIQHYEEVQRVLREEIVNPLRVNLFVRADYVMNLRKLLDKLSSVSGLMSEEKDPEEFLNSLLAQILKAEPFLKLNSGQEAYHYQLFVDKDHDLELPSVQQLFEQSFLTSDIKLKEVPSCLIIQMPRFGKNYKMYPRIIPSQILDVTDVIENSPRQCTVCGNLAEWECKECYGQCASGLESITFCNLCLEKVHSNKNTSHTPRPIGVPNDFLIIANHCYPPRLFMELFAVICIETSHYVAFVKCGSGHEAPWCFFDSMADRKGERNGYNIPEMVACPDISKWLSDEQLCRSLHEAAPTDRHLPEYARRLLCDAYICMYQSPDVMMYR